MDARLDNTLNVWREAFINACHNIESAWKNTQLKLKEKQLDGFDNFDDFAKALRENKEEALKKHYVIGGLNIIINDDETVKNNIKLLKNMGFVNIEGTYKKVKDNDQTLTVNDYMINTHTTEFLKELISK